ncbi:uncharacterized protein TNCV_2918431 [Trichonephila clavipes]|nr:uncharacterized protein TNCV_2918431 [Trichonephila clavipes]
MWCSKIFVASPPGSKTFWKDSNWRLSFSVWAHTHTEVKLSPSPSLNWQVLLDIFSTMDGVSNSSPNGYLWVGLSQKYQQVFFTSRTKPAELRKSVPRSVLFPFAFGRIMNLVKTDLPSICTITWVVRASPVVC